MLNAVKDTTGDLARACLVNVDDRGRLMLERLAAEGRVVRFWQVEGSARWCFEFSGELSIGFEDYIAGVPEAVLQKKTVMDALRGEFRRFVVNEILRTVSGARVVEVTDYHITLEETERTEVICVRVTPAEKDRLRREASERGLSLSEYLRIKLLG